MLNDQEIKTLMTNYKNVAVVGLSPEPERPSYGVTKYMIDHGYQIAGVRPGGTKEILGRPVSEKLSDVKDVEVVVVFRASEHIPKVVDEVLKTSAKVLWLQLGITHPESEERARKAGLQVVSNRCFLIEHRRLFG